MLRETFDWLKPSLLWRRGLAGANAPDFFQPQLIKLNDDNFMATFRAVAASSDPTELEALVVTPQDNGLFKLFQPAHGCYYLICAALCCRTPGFPERVVQRTDGESVFFVIRRLFDDAEYGWVVSRTNGALVAGAPLPPVTKSWQPLGERPRRLLKNEERLRLFPITGSDSRTILIGYVPVASRDVYAVTAQELNNAATAADADPLGQTKFPIDIRIEELQAKFTTAIKNKALQGLKGSLVMSVYMLLDLWEFLDTNLPDVAAALRDNPTAGFTGPQAAAKQQLMSFLASQALGGGLTLAAGLGAVARQKGNLEAVNVDPSFADPMRLGFVDPTKLGFDAARYDLNNATISPDALDSAVRSALPTDTSVVLLPRQSASPAETFVIRCVYERPQCLPPLQVVSQASVPFQLAPYYDADAPAREIRIVLPTDVSIRGMRKFQKGVKFMISGSMQQKINMITGNETNIIKDGTVGSEGTGLAFMCSFSIQIIFIVAFFLLLMFVIILNIAFWWIAFFRICIPIPKKLLSG
jgi:hypothetical protein